MIATLSISVIVLSLIVIMLELKMSTPNLFWVRVTFSIIELVVLTSSIPCCEFEMLISFIVMFVAFTSPMNPTSPVKVISWTFIR